MPSRALIIGPSEYGPQSGIASHDEIARSRDWYGEVLKDDGRWGTERVEVLPASRLGSVNEVMEAIQSAADDTEAGDTLLVVYIGHGAYWSDLPDPQVYFAVGSSQDSVPYTWLSSYWVYRAMRKSRASIKVLIADCCNSNFLGKLSDPQNESLPGALGEIEEGSCVLAAVKNRRDASAEGCKNPLVKMEDQFRECTAFSGHLLNLLWRGTPHVDGDLTLGTIRDILSAEMARCNNHDRPRMILSDAREGIPLFSNKLKISDYSPEQNPDLAEEWVDIMMGEKSYKLKDLLDKPEKAGRVVALLFGKADDAARAIALRVNRHADMEYQDPSRFACYWAEAARALEG